MKNLFRWLGTGLLTLMLLLLPARLCSAQCTTTLPAGVVAVDPASQAQSPDGRSWACAFPTIQQALAAVQANGQVWVKAHTYKPGTSASDTFELVDGTWLLGGFDGTELDRVDADPYANPTTLSGNLTGGGTAHHVVTAVDTMANLTRLDGFIITGGNASGGATVPSGGGLLVLADEAESNAQLDVTRCRFLDNHASNGGGAAAVISAAAQSINLDVVFTNCEFADNTSPKGGAVYIKSGGAIFNNSLFAGNTAAASDECVDIVVLGAGEVTLTKTDAVVHDESANLDRDRVNLATPSRSRLVDLEGERTWIGALLDELLELEDEEEIAALIEQLLELLGE